MCTKWGGGGVADKICCLEGVPLLRIIVVYELAASIGIQVVTLAPRSARYVICKYKIPSI